MTTTPKTLRSRNLTAARRSLTLIRDAVAEHLVALNDGVVPGDDFLASVLKYEAARTRLGVLDALGEDGEDHGPETTVEVQADDLEALVLFARGFVTEAGRQPGSPIDNLTRAVYPDGIVPAEQPS